jgi:hypothetical protein
VERVRSARRTQAQPCHDQQEGSRPAHGVPPTAGAILALSRTAGNAAVARIHARDTSAQATRKPGPVTVGAVEGGPIDFATKVAKLGELEIHFEGRLTVIGSASLDGDAVPDDKDLPDPANRSRTARVHKWGENRVRDHLKRRSTASRPPVRATKSRLTSSAGP